MKADNVGSYTKTLISDIPIDKNDETYKHYNSIMPKFPNQSVYIYSFAKGRMVYAEGWDDTLGYADDEITMLKIVSITAPRFMRFSGELNDKAMMFLKDAKDDLTKYSFTIELEKIHKDGSLVPLFSRVAVHKVTPDNQIVEIIGYSEVISTLKLGNVMHYAAYGPNVAEFEDALNKELFHHYAISRKEKEALALAARGYAFKEIADELGVSQSAIEKRIIPLYKRFNVKSLPHLIGFAYQNNIL